MKERAILTLPLLMVIPAVIWSGPPAAAGVLAGWAAFRLNRKLLLHCLRTIQEEGFVGRVRKNAMIRLLLLSVILWGCAAADSGALLWGASSLIFGQTLWLFAIGRSFGQKEEAEDK